MMIIRVCTLKLDQRGEELARRSLTIRTLGGNKAQRVGYTRIKFSCIEFNKKTPNQINVIKKRNQYGVIWLLHRLNFFSLLLFFFVGKITVVLLSNALEIRIAYMFQPQLILFLKKRTNIFLPLFFSSMIFFQD